MRRKNLKWNKHLNVGDDHEPVAFDPQPELETYFQAELFSAKAETKQYNNLVDFWQRSERRFPHLVVLARRILVNISAIRKEFS